MGFGVAVGTAVGAAVGAAVGLAVGAAVGAAVGFAVGAGAGLAALPEGLLLEVLELLGFAVAAGFAVGLTVLLLSVFDVEDVLLGFELSVLVFGFAVGLAVAVGFVLAAGLLLNAALLSFSATALLVLLAAELSVSVFSATLFPVHPAKDAMSTVAIIIAVSFFFILISSSVKL